MSMTSVRQEFADALSTVDGITGYTNTPTVFSTGDAWPRWVGLEPQGAPSVFIVSWQILIVCGGTPADAETYAEQRLQAILEAIEPVAYASSVAPTVIQTSSGDLYGVVVTAIRE